MNATQADVRHAPDWPEAESLLKRHARALERRAKWEGLWQDCIDYALPNRDGLAGLAQQAQAKTADGLYDGTAADAADQLAASLLAQLTPPWSRWFALAPGPDVAPEEQAIAARVLDGVTERLQSHFDRSNFAVEIHQCYLDLVTVGSAVLLFEDAAWGAPSAFRFQALPIGEIAFEEGATGRIDSLFRRTELTLAGLRARFANADLPDADERQPDRRHKLVECVWPDEGGQGYRYAAILEGGMDGSAPQYLRRARLDQSPFVTFRWLKAPGEVYGRSPIMKALPDIRTANKVVELTLKNASIAVTGIWQADDDGVLNPANVRLVPGAIIPKAVGSSGLTPLAPPGQFDISELVLTDLRKRIRHALLADRLAPIDSPSMTATEVLERSSEMTRLLGATFGRLQSELLLPLVARGLDILRRRGEAPPISIDGEEVDLVYQSPLARMQAMANVQTSLMWLNEVRQMGPDAQSVVDVQATVRWLARMLGVPGELVRDGQEPSAPPQPSLTPEDAGEAAPGAPPSAPQAAPPASHPVQGLAHMGRLLREASS